MVAKQTRITENAYCCKKNFKVQFQSFASSASLKDWVLFQLDHQKMPFFEISNNF